MRRNASNDKEFEVRWKTFCTYTPYDCKDDKAQQQEHLNNNSQLDGAPGRCCCWFY